jgi:toxin ParE1/3/4
MPYEPDNPALADLPVSPLSRFKKYLIFYRQVAAGIEVVRVLHGARDIPSILEDHFGAATEDGA